LLLSNYTHKKAPHGVLVSVYQLVLIIQLANLLLDIQLVYQFIA